MTLSRWATGMEHATRIPPATKTYLVDLPLCALHVMEAGDGPTLVIVPATISELENWESLVQFMAQWFRVYFFELPGHGQSTPFAEKFSTEKVAQVVGQLADRIGAQRFNLMGFSFGGILAMKTYELLKARIDRVVFIAPCIATRAVLLSHLQQTGVLWFSRLLKTRGFRWLMLQIKRNRITLNMLVSMIRRVGRVEKEIRLDEKISKMGDSTMDVIARELEDIISTAFPHPPLRHQTLCYFAMSIHDPLLDFQATLDELQAHFENIFKMELTYPFHQPPRPFTLEELNRDFGETVDKFMLEEKM